MMGVNGNEALEEEYNLMLRAMQNFIAQNEDANRPVLLQVQRDGAEGRDQMTVFFSRVVSDSQAIGRHDVERNGGVDRSALGPSLFLPTFMADLGPLIMQALVLQNLFGERRRRIAAPLEEEAVGHLQRMALTHEIIAQLEVEERNVCSICQESFASGSEVYCLPCGHIFDVQCLRQWLEQTRTCPNCRFLLQDVEQQYKDAVIPVWWCGVCDSDNNNNNDNNKNNDTNGNEQEGSDEEQQASSTNINFLDRDASLLPQTVEIIRSPDESVQGQEEEREEERSEEVDEQCVSEEHVTGLPCATTTPQMSPFFASCAGSESIEAVSQDNCDHSFFFVRDGQATEGRRLTPEPPVDEPRRVCGAFRERFFAEEPIATPPLLLLSTTTTASHSADSHVARSSNGQSLLRQQPPTFERDDYCCSSTPSLNPSSSPTVVTDRNDVSAHILARADVSPIFSSQREYNCNSGGVEHPLPATPPHLTPRSPQGERTSCRVSAPQDSSQSRQLSRQIVVAGNARQAVQALRRCREEEAQTLRSSSQTSDNNNNTFDDISVAHPRRYRSGNVSRAVVLSAQRNLQSPLAPPQMSLRVSEKVRHQRGINGGGAGGSGEQQRESQPPSEPFPRGACRGNRRNLAQYESIIRGNRHR